MSAQNTSSAVMQQRREASDSFDYFPTPLWATRALCEWMFKKGIACRTDAVHESACGEGHMARALQEYFGVVLATDIQPFGYGGQADYLFGPVDYARDFDWIITNPPFRLAEQFIERAIRETRKGCAMFVRTSFLEGVGRYNNLYSQNPPDFILQFSERVIISKGVCRDPAKKYWCESSETWKTPSTATSYCWLIWSEGENTSFDWIPPCRKRLERPGDYA